MAIPISGLIKLQDYFYFGDPILQPRSFSLVMKNGNKDGYACYVKGNNNVFNIPAQVAGYADCNDLSYDQDASIN